MIGITIKPTTGIGDQLQFSSLPENYFKATGKKLMDVSKPWFFDHNPYVVRDEKYRESVEMWNFSPEQYPWPNPRREDKPAVYLSNAEIWASVFKVPCVMNRPRLYKFEEFPYHRREMIILHLCGNSHGEMPDHVIRHIIKKYGSRNLWTVGPQHRVDYHLPRIVTPTLWELAEVISRARLFIGVDSGPSWIAACFPDVIVKKVRTKPHPPELFENWVPLEIRNIHSYWDDRCHQIYNVSDKDVGFTQSYKKI